MISQYLLKVLGSLTQLTFIPCVNEACFNRSSPLLRVSINYQIVLLVIGLIGLSERYSTGNFAIYDYNNVDN